MTAGTRTTWVALLILLGCSAPSSAQGDRTAAFVGGRVFDGDGFVERDVFVAGGQFVSERPAEVDTTVDVSGQFLVPPYGDFHTHVLLDSANAARYIREGTFYVQNLMSAHGDARPFRESPYVDGAYALGGWTTPGSHPHTMVESYALGLNAFALSPDDRKAVLASRTRAGDAYWLAGSVEAVEEAWPEFLADDPDVVKVFLSDVAAGLAEGDIRGHGLAPDVLGAIVRRARAAGIRVVAHVDTADDVRFAVEAGVDAIAHLPGYNLTAKPLALYDSLRAAEWERYRLDDETVRLMGERGVIVNPTVHIAESNRAWNTQGRPERFDDVREFLFETLRRLDAAGARVVVGQDDQTGAATTWAEAQILGSHVLFDPAKVLRTWTTTTPQAIFPDRRIGEIAPGYEASLLVLDCSPLEDFDCTQSIRARVKDGQFVSDGAGAPPSGP